MRCMRGSGLPIAGCALVVATSLLAGCTRVIAGTVHSVVPEDDDPARVPVADLLIEPERFPARYPAVVLDHTAAYRVLQDIGGVPEGSVVTPPECAPPPLAPQHTAAAQGIDSENAGSLIVAVTRPAPPLRARADQLTACPSFTAVRGEDTSSVTVTLLPAPPVDADDSYAVDQTATSQPSGSKRRTLTLVAQVGEVRLSASWLQDGTEETAPDMHSLDTLFSDAVLKVRRVAGP
jgi:hypothetical protein